jgi:hypothetical protein
VRYDPWQKPGIRAIAVWRDCRRRPGDPVGRGRLCAASLKLERRTLLSTPSAACGLGRVSPAMFRPSGAIMRNSLQCISPAYGVAGGRTSYRCSPVYAEPGGVTKRLNIIGRVASITCALNVGRISFKHSVVSPLAARPGRPSGRWFIHTNSELRRSALRPARRSGMLGLWALADAASCSPW